jgi:hypothetical protein
MRRLYIILISAQLWGACDTSSDPTLIAASASRNDVNDCVTAATDGDTILIPNGSIAWASGISTTKQIIIRAQNYTPTAGGSATRNVTITNNSSAPLFSMTSGNSYHVGVGGIRFDEGTSFENAIHFEGTGSKVPLLFDCYFENKERLGSAEGVAIITWLAQGGVMWNIRIDGLGATGPDIGSVSIHWKSPRAWTTASTMGTLDTGGTVNVYVEDSTFVNTGGGDIDDGGRVVMRYSTFDGSVWITHGFTSLWGGRHWESYNNTYSVTTELRNHSGRYFWCRAGTGIFTDNVVNNSAEPSNYGSVNQLEIGDNTSPSSYPMPRQPGGGHNGTNYVVDPIYIWNNTGTRAYTYGIQDSPDDWTGAVQLNRDLFVNNGAKPSYSKYTYPHPARTTIEGGGGTPPTITTSSLPGGTVGSAYSQTLVATGDTPITWSITGSLPGGLTIDTGTGAITGTPTVSGTASFTAVATNTAGENTKPLSITISPAGAQYSYNLNAVSTVTMGSTVTGSMEAHYHYHTTDGNNFSSLAAIKSITENSNSSFMFLAEHNTSNQLVLRSWRDTNCSPSNELIQSLANKRDIEIVIRRNRVSSSNVTITFELWDKEAELDGFGAYSIATRTCTTSSGLGFSSIRLGDTDTSNTALGFFRLYTSLQSTSTLPPHARQVGTSSVNLTFDGQNGTESNGKTTSFTGATYSATPSRSPVCSGGTTAVYRANAPMVLDGSKSWANDVDSGFLSYIWRATEQPVGSQLWWSNGSTRVDPSVSGAVFGQYTFGLTVTQADGQSATCSITHGAVPTDDRGVVITGDHTVDYILGPVKRWGTSEWPWWDRMHKFQADSEGGKQGGTYDLSWRTLQSGRVDINSTGTTITATGGAGTSFQSEFCGGDATIDVGDRFIVLRMVDPALGTDMYAWRSILSCTSDTSLSLKTDPTWQFGAQTNLEYSSAWTNYAEWAALGGGVANVNFYDSVLAFYNLYYRTGLSIYRDYGRWLADHYIENPGAQNGYQLYQSFPRNQSTLGLVFRMFDGDSAHQAKWMTMMNRVWNTTANLIQNGPNGYAGTRCCDREDAYRLATAAQGAKFTDNPTIRANCLAAIKAYVSTNSNANLSSPTGLGGSFIEMFETAERGVAGSSNSSPMWWVFTIPDPGTLSVVNGSNVVTVSGTIATTPTNPTTGAVNNSYIPDTTSNNWVMWSCPTPCTDNDLGDARIYTGLTRTGTSTATMNENYEGATSSGRTFWIFHQPTTSDGRSLPGWFYQPFMLGIIWSALDQSRTALDENGSTETCPYPSGGSSILCQAAIDDMQEKIIGVLLAKGFNPTQYGVWYSRGSFLCEPNETNPRAAGGANDAGLCNLPGINAMRTQVPEVAKPFTMTYLREGDSAIKTAYDLAMGKAVGKEGGVNGDAVNYATDFEGTATSSKWLGFGFGFQNGASWDAARIMSVGEWPWVPTSRNVLLSARITDVIGAAKVRFTVRDPRGNQVDQDTCTSMPCTLTIADSALGRHEVLIEYLDSGDNPIPGATGAWQPLRVQ